MDNIIFDIFIKACYNTILDNTDVNICEIVEKIFITEVSKNDIKTIMNYIFGESIYSMAKANGISQKEMKKKVERIVRTIIEHICSEIEPLNGKNCEVAKLVKQYILEVKKQ